MRKYSRLEYERHRVLNAFNFLGFFLSLPLVMLGKLMWLNNWDTYLTDRPIYYIVFWSEVLPALTFIFTRPDHDCFNCFNRLTPSRYSIFQWSMYDNYTKCLTEAPFRSNIHYPCKHEKLAYCHICELKNIENTNEPPSEIFTHEIIANMKPSLLDSAEASEI